MQKKPRYLHRNHNVKGSSTGVLRGLGSAIMMAIPYDFYHLWASAVVARHGGDPYATEQITPLMIESGWHPLEMVTGFMHPFWSLAILTPLSYLPFHIAVLVWELSIVLLVGLSVRLFLNPAVRGQFGGAPTLPSVLLATALFPSLLSTSFFGQTSAVLLLGCAGWLSLFCQSQFFASGMLLSLTTLKPQLFIPLYIWVFVNQIRVREWKSLLGFCTGLLLQMCTAALFAPQAPAAWVSGMGSVFHQAVAIQTPAFALMVTRWLGFSNGSSIVPLIAVLAGVSFALVYRGRVAERAILCMLPLGMLTTPYVWSHSFLVLLLPYLVIVRRLEQRREGYVVVVASMLALWGIFEIRYLSILSVYSVILPIVLLVCGWYSVSSRHEGEGPTVGECVV